MKLAVNMNFMIYSLRNISGRCVVTCNKSGVWYANAFAIKTDIITNNFN